MLLPNRYYTGGLHVLRLQPCRSSDTAALTREWLCRIAKGGEGSLETAAAQQVKGAVLKAIGEPRLNEAEAAYAACLASREQALGQQHPETAIAMLGMQPFRLIQIVTTIALLKQSVSCHCFHCIQAACHAC